MSIFNDYRRYSDDEQEYQEWKREAAWECRDAEDEYYWNDDEEEGDEDE